MSCDPALAARFTPRRPLLGRYEVCTDPRPLEDVAPAGWAVAGARPGRCLRRRGLLRPGGARAALRRRPRPRRPRLDGHRGSIRVADLHLAVPQRGADARSSRARWSSGGSATVDSAMQNVECKMKPAACIEHFACPRAPAAVYDRDVTAIGKRRAGACAWALMLCVSPPARAQTVPATPIVLRRRPRHARRRRVLVDRAGGHRLLQLHRLRALGAADAAPRACWRR